MRSTGAGTGNADWLHVDPLIAVAAKLEMRLGLLTYSSSNLGDDLQSLAAARYLPRIDAFVDREWLDQVREATALVLNGWFTHRRQSWPPSQHVRPLLLSLCVPNHDEAERTFKRPEVGDFLRAHGPVGARDLNTLSKLQSWGINSYWSGCLTMTFPPSFEPRGRRVFFVDAWPTSDPRASLPRNEPWFARLPEDVQVEAVCYGHEWSELPGMHPADRLGLAASLLERYRRARLVVTSRLHCALPALALGTPVIFLAPTFQPERLDGFRELLQPISREQLLDGAVDWENPPTPGLPEALVRPLVSQCVEFVAKIQRESDDPGEARAPRRPTGAVSIVRGPSPERLFAISLDRDSVRSAHIRKEVATKWAGSHSVVPAVDGQRLALGQMRQRGLIREAAWLGRELRSGEVGCWLSHLAVLRSIVDQGLESAIVIEDDVFLVSNVLVELSQRLGRLRGAKNSGWDMCFLGCYEGTASWAPRRPERLLPGGFFRLNRDTKGTPGTYAYAVTREGARRLLGRMCSHPIDMPADEVIASLAEDQLRIVCACPPLARPAGFPSTTSQNAASHATPAAASIPRAYMDCLESFSAAVWWRSVLTPASEPG